jgi:hypothetical protein
VKDLSTRNVITRCNSSGPLYTIRLPSHPAPSPMYAPSALVASTSTWHRCLGHPGVDVMSKLSHDSSVISSKRSHNLCHTCQVGRHICIPFVSSNSYVDNIFVLLHYDIWTSPVVSVSGYKYYLVILDDYSHFVWTFDTFFTLSKKSLMFPHKLAAPSKSSSAIITVSSITPPLAHSSPPKGFFYGCLVHTLYNTPCYGSPNHSLNTFIRILIMHQVGWLIKSKSNGRFFI